MKDRRQEIRDLAEADLEAFIRLVHPNRLLGDVHCELIRWWNREDAKSHQLTLLPRDHQKSVLNAYRAAWEITRRPDIRILYISATSTLAIKQVKFIKDILTSPIYQKYWPEMVNPDPNKREKWTETEFAVDHPLRRAENVRDPTVWAAGLTTSITGMHCDIIIMDDVVIADNAYTEEGRGKVARQYSYLGSIAGTGARVWIVGTRYHPKDLYNDILAVNVELFDEDGELIESEKLYEVFERQLEDRGDGTGVYIWPKQRRYDGREFGFDQRERAKKFASYIDKAAFYAQYYNNPNDPDGEAIPRETFQYYDPKFLSRSNGYWTYKGRRLNVFSAIDFAFSLKRKADYTTIVVVGVDADQQYYVLDIDRFKTDKIAEYFTHILRLHQKWDFRKLRAECTAGQMAIVNDLKHSYIRQHGLALSIEDFRPTRGMGSKAERIHAVLSSKYDNRQMWHFQGGQTQILEEELVLQNPPHDDVKDALASAVEACVAPSSTKHISSAPRYQTHNRFGGLV